jgi:hypothetical protein
MPAERPALLHTLLLQALLPYALLVLEQNARVYIAIRVAASGVATTSQFLPRSIAGAGA